MNIQNKPPHEPPRRIQVAPRDNVAIIVNSLGLPPGTAFPDGLVLNHFVPQGHKVALADIADGADIIRYNEVIGTARGAIARGDWINEDNVVMGTAPPLDQLEMATRLPPKNELDDGEAVVMYEVAGVAGRYQFRGEKFSTKNTPFEAKVGDLVVLCAGSEDTPRAIPAGWGPKLLHSGFAARIAEVPLIVKKTRWQPIQVSGSTFYWAIKNVQWKFPDEAFLLASVQLDKDAGNGRWEVATNNDLSYLIEIPPSLKHANLAQPGKSLWFILGHHRFDRTLKKLVLVAEDIEEHYVHEK